MQIQYSIGQKKYVADLSKPLDISIPLKEGKSDNPNCYYAQEPIFEVIRFGESFVGSVAEGGACNYQKITLTPHGNGTHTECYGHLSNQEEKKTTINQSLQKFCFVAYLISISPKEITEEDLQTTSLIALEGIASVGDKVVLKKDIENAIHHLEKNNLSFDALIIRTLPNEEDKKVRQYSGTNPPYLEPAIGEFLAKQGIEHLLLDLPSVDRESDKGKLFVHKGFWNIITENGKDNFSEIRQNATITELIFVENSIRDGVYLLNLQIPALEIDATPSKPVLYEMWEV